MSTSPFEARTFELRDFQQIELAILANLQEIVLERCGEDAKLVIDFDRISIEQPVYYGEMPGVLSTDLVVPPKDDVASSWLRFIVAFRAVDAFEFEPVDRGGYYTLLPVAMETEKQTIALTAIHETAKAHLTDGFSRAMALMSYLDPAAVEKLLHK